MFEGCYISMRTFILSCPVIGSNYVISIIYCLLFEKISSCAAVLYSNPESWPVVGFCPHVGTTGVFGMNLSIPQFWVLEGGVEHNEPDNQTIGLYHSHLAIGVCQK